jgi:hypothetical protein
MNHPELDQLSDFAEGVPVDADAREALERHLADCPACRGEVEWIRSLRDQALRLRGQEVPPPEGLWTKVEAGIRAREGVLDLDRARERRGGGWGRYALQAAAVLFLVALSSFAALAILRSGSEPSGAGPSVAGQEGPGAELRFASAVEEMESAYGPAIRELELALERDRGNLAPETVEVLEENLRIIDQAIRDALAALEADPGSSAATGLVGGMYETKLQVLQQAVRLAREA